MITGETNGVLGFWGFGGGILRRVTIGLFPNVVTGVFNFLLDVRQEAFASRIDNAKHNNILMLRPI